MSTSLSGTAVGAKATSPCSHVGSLLAGLLRPRSALSRPVCRPFLLAPSPRAPRVKRARLVTRNFKPSSDSEESPVVRPKPIRHPLTDDPSAGASPAETATQEVIFHMSPSSKMAAAAPTVHAQLRAAIRAAIRKMAEFMRPRNLLQTLVGAGLPLLLAYLARPQLELLLAILLGSLESFWSWYCASLEHNPLATKVATGVVGTLLGDFIAQRISHRNEVTAARLRGEASPAFIFDIWRTIRMATYGAIIGTPVGHYWFQYLDANVMPEAMTSPQAVLTKMGADQLLMCPINTIVFLAVMRCVEGHSRDAVPYVQKKIGPTLKANYCLWPVAHIINFALVPPGQRILYCNVVGVLWTVLLSMIANDKKAPQASGGEPSTGGLGSGPLMPNGGPAPVGSGGHVRGSGMVPAPNSPLASSSSSRYSSPIRMSPGRSSASPAAELYGSLGAGGSGERSNSPDLRRSGVNGGIPSAMYLQVTSADAYKKDA